METPVQNKQRDRQITAEGLAVLDALREYHRNPTPSKRNALVVQNMELVHLYARKWANQCDTPFDDLAQIGAMGVIKAVERFDISEGFAFSSYAVKFIEGAIQHYLRDHGWGTLRIPRRWVELYSQVTQAQKKLAAVGRKLSLEAIAEGQGIAPDLWRQIRDAREGSSPASLENSEIDIEAPETEDFGDEDRVFELLANLPEVQAKCVRDWVYQEGTFGQIAQRRGLPEIAVEKLVTNALDTIKRDLTSQ